MKNEVQIRPIQEDDLEIIRKWINRPEIRDSLVIIEEINIEAQKSWYDTYCNDDTKQVFAIEYQKRHIGNISMFNIDKKHSRAQLTIFIGEDRLRNKGIGTKALLQLFDLAFRELSLSKISLEVLTDSRRAINCYIKAGMRQEGIFRSHVCLHGKRRDMVVMAILSEEYLRKSA